MNTSFRSIRDALLLFAWGAFVLWLYQKNLLPNYLHPALQPYTLAAGVILIILSLFSLRGILIQQKRAEAECSHDHSCCHDHHHNEHDHPHHHEVNTHSHEEHAHCSHDHHQGDAKFSSLLFKTLVLLMPMAVVLLGQNNHYTINTIQNRGIVQDLSKLPAARASAPVTESTATNATAISSASMPIQVIDLLYAVQMPTYREDFEGKQVELIGQFVPLTVGNPKGNRFQAIRLFMTCCAADAKPVGVTVQYDQPLKIAEMGWVKITGVPTFPMESGRRTAVLVASKVEECPAPAEPFVY